MLCGGVLRLMNSELDQLRGGRFKYYDIYVNQPSARINISTFELLRRIFCWIDDDDSRPHNDKCFHFSNRKLYKIAPKVLIQNVRVVLNIFLTLALFQQVMSP